MKGKSCLTSWISSYDEVTGSIDVVRGADDAYPDFNKAIETVSSNILIDKLMKYKLGKWTMRWTENCWFPELMCCDQRDGVQLEFSHWDWHWDKYYLTSSLMTWMMGQCILKKFANDAELGGVVDGSNGCAASQTAWRNRSTGNSWSLTKADAKFLSLDELPCISTGWELSGQNLALQKQTYVLCWTARDVRQQGTLVAKSVSNLLGCIRESSISRQGEGDPSTLFSTGETSGVPSTVLSLPQRPEVWTCSRWVQQRVIQVVKDLLRALDISEEAESAGTVQSTKQKTEAIQLMSLHSWWSGVKTELDSSHHKGCKRQWAQTERQELFKR